MYILLDFVRNVVIHEKGKDFIKESGTFSTLMHPCTNDITSAERTGEEKDSNNVSYIMLASNQEKNKLHANVAIAALIRTNDPYFFETCKSSVSAIIKHLIPKAKGLQKIYYDHLLECACDPTISKQKFLVTVTNLVM